jgi:D-alanyl-D-alanine carboxypeptidase/D-alanyl-D-alanine-endopeptidase (penicillin-binding protein 4)
MFKLLLILSILTTHPDTKDANMGVLICDYHTGDTIDAFRANSVIPPASTMKLLTTATALEIWGGDYCIATPITYDGYIKEGVLHGNLYIEGRGDPSFGSRYVGSRNFLYHWAKQLRELGITRISGNVVADASYFDGDALNPSWLWEDAGNYYAPGIFALSYLDNTMNIVLRSGPVGSLAEILRTTPHVPEVEFENHIRCTDISYDGAFVHGVPYSNRRYLVGSVPSNRQTFGVKGDLPNPSLILSRDFVTVLNASGIEVGGEATYLSEKPIKQAARTELFIHHSEPLSEIIRHTNHESDNLYAEMLFRIFGSKYTVPCTIHNATDFVRAYWKNRGVGLRSAKLLDGCGLAPQNAISPAMYVQLLRYMYGSKNKDVFLESLPCSGESGTLSSFLRDTELHGKVCAKSGTIGGTKNYAGYIFLPDGRVWVFAVMVNSANCKTRKIQRVIEQYLLDVYKANI